MLGPPSEPVVISFQQLKLDAEKGDQISLFNLGRVYIGDPPNPKSGGVVVETGPNNVDNYANAYKCFCQVAEQFYRNDKIQTEFLESEDCVNSLFYLGVMFSNGLGVDEDYEIAAKWFHKYEKWYAIEHKNYYPIYISGLNYLKKQQFQKAITCLSEVAESALYQPFSNDYPYTEMWMYHDLLLDAPTLAQFKLGDIFYEGLGVARDYIKAYMWWKIALLNHPIESSLYVNRITVDIEGLEKRLTLSDLKKSLELEFQWKQKNRIRQEKELESRGTYDW